ncbi:non-ribosomal peptide synthetase [Variovorax soli]|uniref:Amino acid adenylation domain-containing protein n=1 Tax=Variovorax soli TaxID=376815 RepID=A0ABU1N849_9BURK|nr:non-ribosomal peptide synthetase [Variovorax soli]MDR6534614.1 amino acid adenylation domain-containing protein [Variovorax soli]
MFNPPSLECISPTATGLSQDTLAFVFEAQSGARPSHLAYAFLAEDLSPAQQTSYAELHGETHRLAAWLSAETRPGDRVLLAFPPGLDFVRVFWACLLSGRVAVPVPSPDPIRLHHAAPRLRSVIADSRATLVLTSAALLDAAAAALDPATFAMARWAALPDASALEAASPGGFIPPAIEPHSLAYLQYTSGSTSAPRGVRLSHANVLANVRALIAAGHGNPESRALSWLPHFHDYGLAFGVLAPVVAGASGYLMSPLSFLRRPLRWLDAVEKHRITHTGAPDSAFAACLLALGDKPLGARLDSLVSLNCGAEPIKAETVERVLEVFGAAGMGPRVFAPSYGLAEAVLGVSAAGPSGPPRIVSADPAALVSHRFLPLPEGSPQARRLVGCGQPMQHTEILIVDEGRRCAERAVGEIWVRSPGVGGGYWMQPEASEAAFGGHLDDGSGPWLRTGDLGFLDQGELFVTGRLKDLVIVNGENHYPQDLEWSAERAHPSLRLGHGAAFAVDTPAGEGVVLALEIDRRAEAKLDAEAVFRAVRRAIAVEHGLPVHAVALLRAGTLPRTSSGKVQRHRCREAFLAGELALAAPLDTGSQYAPDESPEEDERRERLGQVLPRDEREQAVWDIWCEVLGTRAFGVHESFFELGGNSLRMTQVLSRVSARFGAALPLVELFEHASVAAMAAAVARELKNGAAAARAAQADPARIRPVARGAPLPASLSQRRMWVIQRFDPASTAYNVPMAIRLRGALDASLCQQALDAMVRRHEGLRTCFVMGEHEPMQQIAPTLAVPLEQIDLGHLPERERHAQARALLAERAAQPFDLSQAPLHRPTLIRFDARDHVLFWTLHHAITDNWASALLMRETLAAYGALAAGREPLAAPPAIGYADYAAWERSPEAVEARRHHLDYWLDRLRGLPDLDLPTDFPRPDKASHRGGRVSAPLPPRLREAMHAFGGREAVTPFVVYLSAFALMLSRRAKSEDIAIGTPIANRHRFATEPLVGTLVNTLVMRTDLAGDPSFTQLVHRVRRDALEAYAHQDAPFDELIDALGHDRTLHPEGPVRVLFNVLNAPVGDSELFGLEIDEFDFERVAAQFDLSMHIDTEFTHRIHLEYASDLYSEASAARMLESYLSLVERLLAQPERRISEHEMLSPAELNLLRHGWNGRRSPLPARQLVHDYLDLGAAEVRERVAVVDAAGRMLRYGELEARSNQLAHALRLRGIARGQRIGLCIARSPDMLIAQLGVMKAGAAYVPLDPDYPADRLRFMAVDADLSAVLAQQGTQGILEGLAIPTIAIDDKRLAAGQPAHPLAPDAALDATPLDEAYLIYTSGSTGQPKGVRVPHRGVVNFLAGMVKMPGLSAEDCVLAITSPSFDPSVLDLLLPLVVRAKVVIASQEQVHDPAALRRLLEIWEVTLLQATPSGWRALIETGWAGTPRFRALIGGESLPPVLAEQLMARSAELWNIYGPTETTVWATAWKVHSPRKAIAVGQPIDNVTVWVLDAHGHACPIGVPGELYVGGAGVTLGYHQRDELTAERFVPDPFGDELDARLYRTGDLGRWRHDGQLELLGRADHQVKLRGFRVEMGEIESALLDHPELAHCVAVTRAEREEDVRLVAYFVARGPVPPAPPTLREHLSTRLPHYMIPQHFVALDTMPMLPNGKVDRAALPAPMMDVVLADGRSYVAPSTQGEQIIASVWSELLGVEEIGRTDNFFDLGGHSLLAMRAVSAIESMLGWKIAPRRLIYESLQQIAREENLQAR